MAKEGKYQRLTSAECLERAKASLEPEERAFVDELADFVARHQLGVAYAIANNQIRVALEREPPHKARLATLRMDVRARNYRLQFSPSRLNGKKDFVYILKGHKLSDEAKALLYECKLRSETKPAKHAWVKQSGPEIGSHFESNRSKH